VSPVPAGPDDRPRRPGALVWPGSVMTEAPAQRRDRPGPGSADPADPVPASTVPASTVAASTVAASTGPANPSEPGLLEIPDPSRGRWGRVRWLFAAIWLVYLAQPASRLWSDPDLARRYLGLADLIAFSALFIVTFAAVRFLRTQRTRRLPRQLSVAAVVAEVIFVAFAYIALGPSASSLFIYVGVMAVFLLPTREGWAVVAACIAASLIIPSQVHGWTVDGAMAFQIFVSAVAAWGVGQLIQRNAQLVAARNEITRLALADQRNQFARDLHDILGHSLTVVAVKAELAGRLASLDPQQAETEIADVERIARQALADVRAAAAGYREITLAGELASAQTALAAAGIEADLPDQDVGQIPRPQQELFGWTVREGVTNVVRHSGATRCRIRVSPGEVEISDDGCGPPAPAGARPGAGGHAGTDRPASEAEACGGWAPDDLQRLGSGCGAASGHGLAGLRERATGAGATLSVGRSAADGFALRVRLP
jgi:two-component system sensor histidine kinase DesK